MADLSVDHHDRVTRIALDRPERRNALSLSLMEEMLAALRALTDATEVGRRGGERTGVLRRPRPLRDGRARCRVLRPALHGLHRADARGARHSAARDRQGRRRRDGRGLPTRGRLRPRRRVRGRVVRHARGEDRTVLLHADGAADARDRPSTRTAHAAHRPAGRRAHRARLGSGERRRPRGWSSMPPSTHSPRRSSPSARASSVSGSGCSTTRSTSTRKLRTNARSV